MNGVCVSQAPRKFRVATVSLAGCFGCHMSLLDIDERIFELIEHIEFDRSPLTDIKQLAQCDIGLIEGGLCNAENVQVLRDFRAHCKTLVAVGACAINGGLPAQRNHLDLATLLTDVYRSRPDVTDPLHAGGVVPPGGIMPVGAARPGMSPCSAIPNDPELPLPLNKVRPIHEVVHVDYFLPGCPPSADTFWRFLCEWMAGRTLLLDHDSLHYD